MAFIKVSGGPHSSTVKITNADTGEEFQGVQALEIVGVAGDLLKLKLTCIAIADLTAELQGGETEPSCSTD